MLRHSRGMLVVASLGICFFACLAWLVSDHLVPAADTEALDAGDAPAPMDVRVVQLPREAAPNGAEGAASTVAGDGAFFGRLLLRSSQLPLAGCAYWASPAERGSRLVSPAESASSDDEGRWRVASGGLEMRRKVVFELSPVCWLVLDLSAMGNQGDLLIPDADVSVSSSGLQPGDSWSANWYPTVPKDGHGVDWVDSAWDELKFTGASARQAWVVRRFFACTSMQADRTARFRAVEGAAYALVVESDRLRFDEPQQTLVAPRHLVVSAGVVVPGFHVVLDRLHPSASGVVSLRMGEVRVDGRIEQGSARLRTGALPESAILSVRLDDGSTLERKVDVRAAERDQVLSIAVDAMALPLSVSSDRPLQSVVFEDVGSRLLVVGRRDGPFVPADFATLLELGPGRFAVPRHDPAGVRRILVVATDGTAGEVGSDGAVAWFPVTWRKVTPRDLWALPPETKSVRVVVEVRFGSDANVAAVRCWHKDLQPSDPCELPVMPGWVSTTLVAAAQTSEQVIGLPERIVE